MTGGAPGSNGRPHGKPSSDLWSIPAGAVELDDEALWGNGDILDRLSAVLPEAADPQTVSAGAAHRHRTGTRRARRAAEVATGEPVRRPRKGMVVAILMASFSAAVMVGLWFPPTLIVPGQPAPSGSSTPAGPASNPSPVTNGPSECPMYAAPPEGPNVPPGPQSGGCFFVG
jgi:hypothetical protein